MTNETFQLTDENYYTREANLHYMSAHTFMDYLENKEVAWLKHHGLLEQKSSDALINGSLFHDFMESEKTFHQLMETYAVDHIFPKTKKANKEWENLFNGSQRPSDFQVLSPFKDVWAFIDTVWDEREDKIWKKQPHWFKEIILTGEIGGAPFKGKLDALYVNEEEKKAIIFDHKTIALKDYYGNWYDEEQKCYVRKTFMQEHNYDLQMAVYQELVHQTYHIPKENIKFQFGLLIKQGSAQFVNYPSKYLLTEQFTDEVLKDKRFEGLFGTKIDALTLVKEQAKLAFDFLTSEEPSESIRGNILYQTIQDQQTEMIKIENVHN